MIPTHGRVIILREQWPMLIDIDGNHWYFYSVMCPERMLLHVPCYLCDDTLSLSGYQEAITKAIVCDECVDRTRSTCRLAPSDTLHWTDVGPYFQRTWSLNPHMKYVEKSDTRFVIRTPGV